MLAVGAQVAVTLGLNTTAGQLEKLDEHRDSLALADSYGASLVAYLATAQICGLANETGFTPEFEALEPKNEREARRRSDWHHWRLAEETEVRTLFDMGCFELVDRPDKYDPIPLMMRYKLKTVDGDFEHPRYKARLVMQGNLQYEHEYTCSYAPTARMFSLRTFCAIAAQMGLTLHKFDLKAAFVTADVDTVQHVLIPGYKVPEGKAVLLKKALYGSKSAGALYHKDINKFLLDYGFKANSADPRPPSTSWREKGASYSSPFTWTTGHALRTTRRCFISSWKHSGRSTTCQTRAPSSGTSA